MRGSGSFGWNDLPAHFDFPLASDGPATHLFREAGARTFTDALCIIAHLPYGRNTTRDNPLVALQEGRGTCSTKHALLKLLADEHARPDVRLMLGIYRMNDSNTPGVGAVLSTAGLDYLPEAHTYLRIGGVVLDCTTAGSGRAAFLADLMEEQEIPSPQIGAWKVAHHRAFLDRWRAGNFLGALDELWRIRERCIAALSAQ